MRSSIILFLLFLLQIYGTFEGKKLFGEWGNPFFLFSISIAIAWFYFKSIKNTVPKPNLPRPTAQAKFNSLAWGLLSIIPLILLAWPMNQMFLAYNPYEHSDVVMQIETLYERFAARSFPYDWVDVGSHQAFPVYMPFHWLPLALTDVLNIDSRWSGYILMFPVTFLIGVFVSKLKIPQSTKCLICLIPSLPVASFIINGGKDLPAGFELPILAYYTLLGVGILKKNLWLIGIALILCLLSRYTLIFWLPMIFIALWLNYSRKINIRFWGATLVAVLTFYVIPFYLKNPSILLEGIQYHNGAAISEWNGLGNPPVSWTFRPGIYFGAHMDWLLGDMETTRKISLVRIFQLALMVIVNIAGIRLILNKRCKHYWHLILIGTLYLTVMLFYFFSPLVYRYYYMVVFGLSGILVISSLIQEASCQQRGLSGKCLTGPFVLFAYIELIRYKIV